VDDFVLMQIHQGGDDLGEVVLDFHLGEPLPPLDELVEGLVGTNLQKDIDVFVVLKYMLEFHNIWVAERLVDFDLSDQLHDVRYTFCLARERFRELLAIILAAETLFDSRLIIS
jgi:hypothetical protein